MSIPVAIGDLAATMGDHRWAYLLTVRDSMRPHVVAIDPVWDGDTLVMAVGRGTAANASARPDVTLCFPPLDADGYSLIVDGRATVTAGVDGQNGHTVRFAPTDAVLHRPAPPAAVG